MAQLLPRAAPSLANAYLQSTNSIPAGLNFSFFITGVVRPDHAGDCPASQAACRLSAVPARRHERTAVLRSGRENRRVLRGERAGRHHHTDPAQRFPAELDTDPPRALFAAGVRKHRAVLRRRQPHRRVLWLRWHRQSDAGRIDTYRLAIELDTDRARSFLEQLIRRSAVL